MTPEQAASYREGYTKGAADGMRQFARILSTSVGQLAQNNVDEMVKTMINEQQQVAASRAQAQQSSAQAEAKKQAAFASLAASPGVQVPESPVAAPAPAAVAPVVPHGAHTASPAAPVHPHAAVPAPAPAVAAPVAAAPAPHA